MKKIILSLAIIVTTGSLVAVGGTGAFFSDTETSTGNTFTAGAIDLKVDNESYYNGAVSEATSWTEQDLDQGTLFFNFTDLKPDDEGEDTISLHVNDNDAWACMDMTLTSNDDKSSNEPELEIGDLPEDINNTWDGELAQNIQMFWWADDGDNVYEVDELTISDGIKTLYNLATSTSFSVALADATHNVWGEDGPLPGGETRFIAKAWCFGTLSLTPLTQDGAGTDGPLAPDRVGTGFACNGTNLNNLTQTDGATLDLAFRVVQARHNPDFSCGGTDPRLAKLTVIKQIVNNDGGNNIIADYQLFVDNNVVVTPVTSGVSTTLVPDNYTVTETGIPGYVASFSGDCDANGNITLAVGDDKTCTITNNDLAPNITLVKQVIGGTATPNLFKLRVDGAQLQNNTSATTTSNVAHIITEDPRAGYAFTSMVGVSSYGKSCPAVLGGSITLDEGEAITCTITNTFTP